MAQVGDVKSFPATSFAEGFHQERPIDGRYVSKRWHKVRPNVSIINREDWEFVIPKMAGDQVLFLHEAMLEMSLQLTTSTGDVPVEGAAVSPINDFCQTIIKTVRKNCCFTEQIAKVSFLRCLSN
jgi:hypothetical protein